MHCPKCNQKLKLKVTFCYHCGIKINNSTTYSTQDIEPRPNLSIKIAYKLVPRNPVIILWLVLFIMGICYWHFNFNKIAYTMRASELAYEYRINPEVANAKFHKSIIKINGTIIERGRFSDGDGFMLLYNADNTFVRIVFSANDWNKIINFKEGDFIDVKTICYGPIFQNDVNMLDIHLTFLKKE